MPSPVSMCPGPCSPNPTPIQQKSCFSCRCLESRNWAHVLPPELVHEPSVMSFVGPGTPMGTKRDLPHRLPREPFSCPLGCSKSLPENRLLPACSGICWLPPTKAGFRAKKCQGSRVLQGCSGGAVLLIGCPALWNRMARGQLRGEGRDYRSASCLHRSGWKHPPLPAGA